VERSIGAIKLIETEAMRRGRNLEQEVLGGKKIEDKILLNWFNFVI